MALPIFQRTVVNDRGDILPGASIEVRSEPVGNETTGNLVSVYSDRAGTVALGNPFTIGADALVKFYVAPGEYKITALKGGESVIWRYVIVLDSVDVATIGANFADVTTVSNNIPDIVTVSTNIADVNAVGFSIADVNSVADNMPEVLLADTNANTATDAATQTQILLANAGSMLGINFGAFVLVDGELTVSHLTTSTPSLIDGELILTYEGL